MLPTSTSKAPRRRSQMISMRSILLRFAKPAGTLGETGRRSLNDALRLAQPSYPCRFHPHLEKPARSDDKPRLGHRALIVHGALALGFIAIALFMTPLA